MSWRRANSPGWASVDLKQRQQKDGSAFVEAFDHLKEEEKPSFPPISHIVTVQKKNHLKPPVRSFSSVLLPSADSEFPALPDESNNISFTQGPSAATSTSTSRLTIENDTSKACTKLKEIYGWADESLITDVLAAVDDDINNASALLAEMVCSDSTEQKMDKSIQVSKSNAFSLEHRCFDKGTFFEDSADIEELNCFKEGSLNYVNGELSYECISCGDENSNKAAALKNLHLSHWKNVPAEPEWEEDDIYYIHREEALHMMRSASQHSRKATDAYMRGDHFSAQQLSAKARQEWTAAERLNAQAAKEILSIRNSENGPWKLDLHGLHALESVQALKDRLQNLELLVPSDLSLSPNRRNNNNKTTGSGIVRCSSLESLTCSQTDGTVNLDGKYCESSSLQQRRRTSLHVITGIMLHEANIMVGKCFLFSSGFSCHRSPRACWWRWLASDFKERHLCSLHMMYFFLFGKIRTWFSNGVAIDDGKVAEVGWGVFFSF